MLVPQFYVRSNVHMTNLDNGINRLLVNESLIDVTLACDGHRFHCHRLVLAASSPLFEELLMEHPKEHPIVIIPIGVKWYILKSLIDFMYRGQTYIDQAELKTLIESAELLKITGLYDPQTQFREFFSENDNDVNLNNDQESSNVDYQNDADQEMNKRQNQLNSYFNKSQEDNKNNQDENQHHLKSENEDITETETNESKETILDFIEIDDSQDELLIKGENNTPSANDEEPLIIKDIDEPICHAFWNKNDSERHIETEDTTFLESDAFQNVSNMTEIGSKLTNKTASTIKPTIKLINLFKLNRPAKKGENSQSSNVPWTYIHIPATSGSNMQSPSTMVPLKNKQAEQPDKAGTLPKLIPVATTVTSKPIKEDKEITADSNQVVPSCLKLKSDSMSISIKNLNQNKTKEKLNGVNIRRKLESEESPSTSNLLLADENTSVIKDYAYNAQQSLLELKTPFIKEEITIQSIECDSDQNNKFDEFEAEPENIICQPSVSYIYDGQNYGKDVFEDVDDDEDGEYINFDRLVAETYDNSANYFQKSKKKTNKNFKKPTKAKLRSQNAEIFHSLTSTNQPLSSDKEIRNNYDQHFKDPPTLVTLSVKKADLGQKHLCYHNKTTNSVEVEKKNNKNPKNFSIFKEKMEIRNLTDLHTQNAVILRNPRCNQPRHYSNESLYAALMAVKYGDSIYRASRLHQVPRKTLRNWMKRWDIKSQYPMPKQLKDAANKKKLTQNQNA